MAGPLIFFLIGSLLRGIICNEFKVNLPQIVQVVTGSCVTVPCSFDIESKYDSNLNDRCEPKWVFYPNTEPQLTETNAETGDLRKKNCTTTFSNMQPGHTNNYNFRLDCKNALKYTFLYPQVRIEVTDNIPPPTLTPSTLKVKEGELVSLTCSAPAPCHPHPPTLTWTPTLGDTQETLQENQDKTKFKTSVLSFTASHLHHGQTISCTAVYKRQDGRSDASFTTSLIPEVLYFPKNTEVSVSPSGPVVEKSDVIFICSSDANPAVQEYTWYRVDGGQETVIWTGRILNFKVSTERKIFFCKAVNEIGEGRSDFNHIDVLYSPKNVNISVSPSGPVVENSDVTLTCSSEANPAVQKYTWYIVEGGRETVAGTEKILNIKASTNKKIFFCKAVNEIGEGRSSLRHTDVQFPSRILLSSSCTKTANQLNCSCETEGNPSPITHWYLNGQPVNQSSQVIVTNESLNSSQLRSIITVSEPQDRDLSTLLCFSSNSLGSASKQFCVSCLESSRENQGQMSTSGLIPKSVFITTVTAFIFIVFALLFFIWFQKTHYKPRGIGDGIDTNAHLMKDKNEVPNPVEDAIYANSAELRQAENHQPSIETDVKCTNLSADNAEETSKSSRKESEDVVYASVNWSKKSKTKKEENDVNMNPSEGSYLEEENFERGGMLFVNSALEMGSLYAEVKTRNVRK